MLTNKLNLAISVAYKNNGLFFTHLNSDVGAASIPGKLSSMLLC